MLGLFQAAYIDNNLVKFIIHNSKKWLLLFRNRVHLSKEQRLKTFEDEERMKSVPYASVMGSLMYVMFCTRSDICYVVGIGSRYKSNLGSEY